jgi:hypothetical protein
VGLLIMGKVVATRRWVSPRRRKMDKIVTIWPIKEGTWEE